MEDFISGENGQAIREAPGDRHPSLLLRSSASFLSHKDGTALTCRLPFTDGEGVGDAVKDALKDGASLLVNVIRGANGSVIGKAITDVRSSCYLWLGWID